MSELPPMARYTLSIEANTGYSATTEGECTPEQYGTAIAALAAQPGSVGDMVMVDRAALHMVVNALRRDAEEGRSVRGEMADMLFAAATTEAKPAQDAVDAEWKVGPLTDELALILGRPNFACIRYAEMLRELGQEIPRKAEAEQAAVIHWMLGFYATHGEKWAEAAVESMDARRAAISAKKGG